MNVRSEGVSEGTGLNARFSEGAGANAELEGVLEGTGMIAGLEGFPEGAGAKADVMHLSAAESVSWSP